ncbi:MAG: hypothetical protein HKN92_10165, partial [Chitinophagales bacterium]|nr:hypothetical protein [Chitinophagales bacterium]
MRKLTSLIVTIMLIIAGALSFPQLTNAGTSPYCSAEVTHFGIPAETASKIILTVKNLSPTSMLVEIGSADFDPVDFLLVNGGSGATISPEDTSTSGKISRTLSWATAQDSVTLNILWSKVSFGGNWQLSTSDVTLAVGDTCSQSTGPPTISNTAQYCNTPVTHFAGDPPSAINLTIANIDATSMIVEIESADADPVDFLLVLNGSGANISGENTSAGKISRTLTWAIAPDSVDLNILWSKVSFGGNWQLSTSDITVAFADTCAGGGTPGTPGCTDASAANYNPSATTDDGSCLYDIIFSVDMNCMDPQVAFTDVNVTGPGVGWCANCLPLVDQGSGIWSNTFQFPAGTFEYKYNVNSFASQENLVDDMQGGATCAPITDFNTYANRTVD